MSVKETTLAKKAQQTERAVSPRLEKEVWQQHDHLLLFLQSLFLLFPVKKRPRQQVANMNWVMFKH